MSADQDSDVFIEESGLAVSALSPAARILTNLAYALGSIGLLSAASVDAVAVAGRHLGFTVLGSIELVQAAAVLTATGAMIVATAIGVHASVHIVTKRLLQPAQVTLARLADALAAILIGMVAAGSIWVAAEMWPGFEQTELLHIQLRWLRAIWIAGALIMCAIFTRRALGRNA